VVPFFTAGAVLQLGLWATQQGELGQAEALAEEAMGLSLETGEIGGIAEGLDALARVAIRRGAFSRAKERAPPVRDDSGGRGFYREFGT
jgi:hypothetical protein